MATTNVTAPPNGDPRTTMRRDPLRDNLDICLGGAVQAEPADEWTEGRRYMGIEVLAKARLKLLHGDTPAPNALADTMMRPDPWQLHMAVHHGLSRALSLVFDQGVD